MKSFKKKLIKTAAAMSACLVMMSGAAMAEFAQVQNGTWGTVRYNDSAKVFVSATEDVKIRIRMNSLVNPDIMINVWKNGDEIYSEHFFNAVAWKVDEFVDKENSRTFYIIKSNNNYAKQLVMGYDKVIMQWRVYLDSSTYYNGIGGTPNFIVKNGDLLLEYTNRVGTKHTYKFTWDPVKRGFASEDLG